MQNFLIIPKINNLDESLKLAEEYGFGFEYNDFFIPDILDVKIIDDLVEVTDEDAINTARELALTQGLLCGTSSGANVWAAKQMARKYGKDKIIATILADRVERYFSTSLI